MDTLMKADIFFFITTIAVIAMTICVILAAYYVIRILRNVDEISEEVKEESQIIREDIQDLRSNIKREGVKVKHFADFVSRMSGKRPHRAQKEKSE